MAPIFRENGSDEEHSSLLPTTREDFSSAYPAKEVTKVALRLKYQIECVIPCEIPADTVTTPLSPVITPQVIQTAREAGGERFKACVVYALLCCKSWFSRQGQIELWDKDLHDVRGVACEIIAKRIVEDEEDQDYLMEQVLLKRFAILVDGEESQLANVIERSVDIASLVVIGSSAYQKAIRFLFVGWYVQDDTDSSRFVQYKDKINTSYWVHLDPDRMRVPQYQNALHITFSIIYLALFTGAINTVNPSGDLDAVEGLLYIFTLGFIADELSKFYKVGRFYISFWNVFNLTLYTLLSVSFVTRMIALSHGRDTEDREHFNMLSYNFLAFTAPMFWMRLMLYFDTFRFFGTMLVVVKIMMKESLIFFALLFFVLIGFFQAFVGLDSADEEGLTQTKFIVQAMVDAVMSSPEYGDFELGGYFGLILYYIFTFVIMVVLLNILIALYGTAYSDITENSVDEYMALFAQKCLRFVRAPDDNVFIPPLNLIEIVVLVLPFEWWMDKQTYERLNDIVMGIIYAPLLVVTAALEQQAAKKIHSNRRRGEEDDDTIEEWEQLGWKPEGSNNGAEQQVDGSRGENEAGDPGWCEKVSQTNPNIKTDKTMKEFAQLRAEVAELKDMLGQLVQEKA